MAALAIAPFFQPAFAQKAPLDTRTLNNGRLATIESREIPRAFGNAQTVAIRQANPQFVGITNDAEAAAQACSGAISTLQGTVSQLARRFHRRQQSPAITQDTNNAINAATASITALQKLGQAVTILPPGGTADTVRSKLTDANAAATKVVQSLTQVQDIVKTLARREIVSRQSAAAQTISKVLDEAQGSAQIVISSVNNVKSVIGQAQSASSSSEGQGTTLNTREELLAALNVLTRALGALD
ncbi:hypothetical protein DL96DRAFT_1587414 [Flagelloscypha sp. PMI_526]|nr:hypothetical protein DL96DRAFT_1587414 [Flagelloscypha sp. PMI_526]